MRILSFGILLAFMINSVAYAEMIVKEDDYYEDTSLITGDDQVSKKEAALRRSVSDDLRSLNRVNDFSDSKRDKHRTKTNKKHLRGNS